MRKQRTSSGESLVSILVATLLIGIVAAAVGSLAVLSSSESSKLQGRVAGVDQARIALDRIGRLVRMARNIGDLQGQVVPASDPTVNVSGDFALDYSGLVSDTVPVDQVIAGTACNMSATFPSVGDPYYGPSGSLKNATSWPWGGGPYTLSADTLVVQVPTFDDGGFPNRALRNDPTQPNIQALDTYVYKIVVDNDYKNEMKRLIPTLATTYYKLEVACFPAEAASTNMPRNWSPGKPITVLRGIVGPLDRNGKITVFQYVNQRSIAGGQSANSVTTNFDDSTAEGAANQDNLPLFTGVMCNFQLMSIDVKRKPMVETLRSEMFLRNNASATIMGTPPSRGG